jgi:hypothetical protein
VSLTWPDAGRLRALPENHRRVVGAALRTILQRLPELVRLGVTLLDDDGLETLRTLLQALAGEQRPPNLHAVRLSLLVLAEDLEPRRLAGYGALTAEQRGVLEELVAALRLALSPRPSDAERGR